MQDETTTVENMTIETVINVPTNVYAVAGVLVMGGVLPIMSFISLLYLFRSVETLLSNVNRIIIQNGGYDMNPVTVTKMKSFVGGVLQMVGTFVVTTAGADYVVRTGMIDLNWEIYRLVLSIPILKMYHQFGTGMTLFIAILGIVIILIGMGVESSADTDLKIYSSIANRLVDFRTGKGEGGVKESAKGIKRP